MKLISKILLIIIILLSIQTSAVLSGNVLSISTAFNFGQVDNSPDNGNINVNSSSCDEKIRLQLRLIDSLRSEENFREMGYALFEVSHLYRSNLQYKEAKEALFSGLRIMDGIGDRQGLADANSYIGMYYWRRSEFDSAVVYMERSTALYKEVGDTLNYGIDLNSLGSAYYQVGLFDKALSNYLESNKIRMKSGDLIGISKICNNIGLLYLDMSYEDKAKEYFDEGLKWANESADSNVLGYSYNNFGAYYEKLGNLKSALFYYFKSFDTYSDKGFSISILNKKNIGRVYLKQNDLNKAKEHLNLALHYAKLTEDRISQAEVYKYLGMLSIRENNYTTAISKIDSSLSISIATGRKEFIKDNYKLLSEIYEKIEEKDKALKYFKNYHDVYINIYNQQVGTRVSVLEEQQENERKNLELSIRELKLQGEESTTHFITAIAVSLLVIVIFMINFNRKIKNSNLRLKNQNSQIEEQRKALDEKNKYLNTLSSTKNKLFSILAHDLRNPFHSMLGFSDLLLTEFDSLSSEEQRQYIEIIKRGLNSTYDLLVNLLFWSQANTGSLEKRPENFEFMRLIISNIKLVESHALQKEIAIEFNQGDEVQVFADENMVEIVLRNIITNAIKYTPRNGKVIIYTNIEDGFLRCSIKDGGIGIEEENLDHIFDLEKKLNRNGTEGERGTGLGLVLAKEFIEINGGKIYAESRPREGSTFTFTIPLAE